MSGRELPVLGLPFRRYPTRLNQQAYDDEHKVCGDCLSGACCESEDPIYLASFDVFRLAAFFDMSAAEFLLMFTQERFDNDPRGDHRRDLIDAPDSSVVTYLRRRENAPHSPCIFLRYIREGDGTARRICSVYEARPLACREFYFDTCKKRSTGELAAILAEGYEKMRDGEIPEARVDAEIERLRDGGAHNMAENMESWFWSEMKRVLNLDDANVEGSSSYTMANYQDPIDEKLNRILSARFVRFEEHYGPQPHEAQLIPYRAGLSFAGSSERERIMNLVSKPPSRALFTSSANEIFVGLRTLLPGAKHAEVFAAIPDSEIESFLIKLPTALLFPDHDSSAVRATTLREIYSAVLKGHNHLIRFASYLAAMGDVLEEVPSGEFESEIFTMIADFETSLNPFVGHNPYFEPVKQYMAEVTIQTLENDLAAPMTPKKLFKILRLLSRTDAAIATLSSELRGRFAAVTEAVDARLQKDRLDLYVPLDNPVEIRRRAGKRLNSRAAWSAWGEQVLDMRYAEKAGFVGIDFGAFFARSVDELERLPFRRSYIAELSATIASLARSVSFHNRTAYSDIANNEAAHRLSEHALSLLRWIYDTDLPNLDSHIISQLASSAVKGLGRAYNDDRSFGVTVRRVLDSQLPDGSWNTNPVPEQEPDSQADYLRTMYRATWTSVDVLRPMWSDVMNPANAALGLA